MHQHHILERFCETIPNVNIYKSELDGVEKPAETIQVPVWMASTGFLTPSDLLCKYLHFMEWSPKPFPDHPNEVTDTDGFEAFTGSRKAHNNGCNYIYVTEKLTSRLS